MKLFQALFALAALGFQQPAPETGASDLSAARAFVHAHQNAKAVELLRRLLAQDPAATETSALLAEVLLEQEEFDEADDVINAAVKAHPDSARLHAVRGDIVFREGHPFEADAEYKKAVQLDPKNAQACFGEARIFDMVRLRARAAVLYRMAHLLDTANSTYEAKYDGLQGYSPANLERWQERLARPGIDDHLAKLLSRRIAIAKALIGKPEFELASDYAAYQIPLIAGVLNGKPFGPAVSVAIGRVKTNLRLDTGASGLMVSSKFAQRAGIERLADTELSGIGNDKPRSGWIGYAEHVEIGGVQFRNCIVEVSDHLDLGDQDGLIGTDIFDRFLVKINFYTHRLELSPLPGPAWDGTEPVDRQTFPGAQEFAQMLNIGHYLLLPGKILPGKINEKAGFIESPGLFLIDTGSDINLLSTNMASNVTKTHGDYWTTLRGVSGKVKKVYTANQVVLEFAKFRQANLDMLTIDLTDIGRNSGTEVSAILGIKVLTLFRSITLDYRDGLVKFDYQR